MKSQAIKEASFLGIMILGLVGTLGFIGGYSVNPVVESLEVRDLNNELALTEGELSKRNSEIETKDELSQQYCNEYKKVKK